MELRGLDGQFLATEPRIRGWTLVEMLFVVLILVVLLAFAYPLYIDQILESRRADGHALLYEAAQRQQQHLARCGQFTNVVGTIPDKDCGKWEDPDPEEGLNMLGADDCTNRNPCYYRLSIENFSTTTYRLVATPQPPQDADTECGNLTLDHLGSKGCGAGGCVDPVYVQGCW